ncbi:MAG: 4Fe-4S dicluster domain-containing protein [Desulfobulbaceae bacterium]|nr:4Fe-4S dicluster domain-containing protein [Desulfobulbaceae bacterium]
MTGLKITQAEFFRKPITLQYPHEVLVMTPRYRGHIQLVKNPETGTHQCISCGLCQKGCPSGCITVRGEKREGVKGKVLVQYDLDFTTCSLCGQCIENCKPGAIEFSLEYNLASTRKEDFHYDLLARLEEQK